MKKPLIILTGPTAVGKTDLSIRLAKAVNGEIISADSMQVYKRMDIGTAKIMPDEMDGVKHYLIDILEPTESFNIFLFKKMASEAIEEIYVKGKIPIIVGGTGFYIQSVLYDVSFNEEEDKDNSIRNELEEIARNKGNEFLHEMLKQVDEEAANAIHPNNVKRVIRAIEFYRQTGKKISEHNEEQKTNESPYDFIYFVLNDDREALYKRIDKRIDIMLEKGLVGEVSALLSEGIKRDSVSMQGLGYKEIAAYLDGEISFEEAVYILKRDTRHFAKRQLTWFRREKETVFVNLDELKSRDAAFEYMLDKIKKKMSFVKV